MPVLQSIGGDSDLPVPHAETGYAACALAGNNAQSSFTEVIKQKIHSRTFAGPASHCCQLVIGDLIPLLIDESAGPGANGLKCPKTSLFEHSAAPRRDSGVLTSKWVGEVVGASPASPSRRVAARVWRGEAV